jgi:hypothetical protein
MNRVVTGLAAAFLLAFSAAGAQPLRDGPIVLSRIAADMGAYQGKTVTMVLRLKGVDRIFERITFYDTKNHDIVFDVSGREIKKKLKKPMLNLHEGLDYRVTFTVDRLGAQGLIMAELVDFVPVIVDLLP